MFNIRQVTWGAGPVLSAALLMATQTACKAIPLNADPNAPLADSRVSPKKLFTVDWRASLVKSELLEYQPRETAQPAVDPDTERVIVATRDGAIRCLHGDTGDVLWEVKTLTRFFAGATVQQGVAYVPGGDGVLYALRTATGEKVWEYKANEELVTAPVIREGKAYVASQSEVIYAVDLNTGKWVWQYRRDAPSGFTVRGTSRPVVSDGLVYMGFADGWLVALGADDGVLRWERRLTLSGGNQFLDVDSTPVVDDLGHVFAASYRDGVYALNAQTGDILWTAARPGLTSLLLRGDVLFATGDGSLSAIETKQGRLLWSLDLSDRTSKGRTNNAGQAAMQTRQAIVVPTSSLLAFVDPSTGQVLEAWNPGKGITATPTKYQSVRHGTRLYVLSNLGTVYALHLANGGR